MSAQLFCVEGDYDAVEAALKGLTGVESVASLPTKKGRNVFVKFSTQEHADAALEQLKTNDKVVLPGQKKQLQQPADADAAATAPQKKKKDGTVNSVADFFVYESYGESRNRQPRNDEDNGEQQGGRGGRGGRRNQREEEDGSNNNRQQQSRGRGGNRRGGRGGEYQQQHQGGGGGRRPRVPMIQGFVAVLDNVPFNATNDQIAKHFATCGGTIYDINRLENMAMVYFDSAEAVQQAILVMNGQKIQNNVITVSSGGSVRVPAPMAPPPPPPGPIFHQHGAAAAAAAAAAAPAVVPL